MNKENNLIDKDSKFVVLTIVSMNKNSFAFQIYNDKKSNIEELFVTLNNELINLKKSIVSYNNHGRITNPKINTWIKENNLHKTLEPLKLVFKLSREGNQHYYTLYKTQGNFL